MKTAGAPLWNNHLIIHEFNQLTDVSIIEVRLCWLPAFTWSYGTPLYLHGRETND